MRPWVSQPGVLNERALKVYFLLLRLWEQHFEDVEGVPSVHSPGLCPLCDAHRLANLQQLVVGLLARCLIAIPVRTAHSMHVPALFGEQFVAFFVGSFGIRINRRILVKHHDQLGSIITEDGDIARELGVGYHLVSRIQVDSRRGAVTVVAQLFIQLALHVVLEAFTVIEPQVPVRQRPVAYGRHGTQQRSDRYLALTVYLREEPITVVGFQLYPCAVIRDELRRSQPIARCVVSRGAVVCAWRPDQLGDHHSLSTVDDERAVTSHERDIAEEDHLLLALVDAFLPDLQVHRHMQRYAIRDLTLHALGLVVRRVQKLKPGERHLEPLAGEILDRRCLFQQRR